MKTLFYILVLCLISNVSFSQTLQYDSLRNAYFAEIQPQEVSVDSTVVYLTRVYIRTVTDTTIDVFIRFALPANAGYESMIRIYGLIYNNSISPYRFVADSLYIPIHAFVDDKINIVYK